MLQHLRKKPLPEIHFQSTTVRLHRNEPRRVQTFRRREQHRNHDPPDQHAKLALTSRSVESDELDASSKGNPARTDCILLRRVRVGFGKNSCANRSVERIQSRDEKNSTKGREARRSLTKVCSRSHRIAPKRSTTCSLGFYATRLVPKRTFLPASQHATHFLIKDDGGRCFVYVFNLRPTEVCL